MSRTPIARTKTLALFAFATLALTCIATDCIAASRGSVRDRANNGSDNSMGSISCISTLPPVPARVGSKKIPTGNVCEGKGTSVVVLTESQLLYLCDRGDQVERFDVYLGCGGLGKTKQGDQKTPLGTYSLSQPRSSDLFHKFILVGYPTREQSKQGYTGSDIGIHGPATNKYAEMVSAIAGSVGYKPNWTQGCIAVWTVDEINRIADFVSNKGASKIHLIAPENTPE